MNSQQRLDSYLAELRNRLRTFALTRAAAIGLGALLVLTAAAVWLLNRNGFSLTTVIVARVLLLLVIAAAVSLAWMHLKQLNRGNGKFELERRLPQQQGRISTYLDLKKRQAEGDPAFLLDLLAEDAATVAEQHPVDNVVPGKWIQIGAAVAIVAAVALVVMMSLGNTYWGYGSRYLLLGKHIPQGIASLRQIKVSPGDAVLRRNGDLVVKASSTGFRPKDAQLLVRFSDSTDWEKAAMRPAAAGEFDFTLFALRGPLRYYVQADGVRSAEHRVDVVDVPKVQKMVLTYSYPEWTGLGPKADDASRDISAVAGTNVKVDIVTDTALQSPALLIDGAPIQLQAAGTSSSGALVVKKPAQYHVSAKVAGELVALTDDYSIEIVQDRKPTIEIVKPGRDARATSIEEVPVKVRAQDDFKLKNVELHYAINGGEWHNVALEGDRPKVDTQTLLHLEEMSPPRPTAMGKQTTLSPGDLISYYAVAKDRTQTVQTDLFIVQVQPFEHRFTEGQGGNGGGSGDQDQQEQISERQKEILLATWNLQRARAEPSDRSPQQIKDTGEMLSELQAKLAAQSRTLADRIRARMPIETDMRAKAYVEDLEQAAKAMDPAAKHLSAMELPQAVPDEQQALQHLLRAESAAREVQIAMQRSSSGSNSRERQELSEVFELEMDLDKNRYETESQVSPENKREELDEAIRKLKELAERQERLAQQNNKSAQQLEEERWRQEQLRRETEQLKKQLEQLAQREQQNQSSQQSSSSQSSSSQSPSSSSSSSSSQSSQSATAALNSVNNALKEMRNAANDPKANNESSANAAREASRRLRQALEQIDRPRGEELASQLDQLAERAERTADEQQQAEHALYNAVTEAQRAGRGGNRDDGLQRSQAQSLAQTKQEIASELTALQNSMRETLEQHRTEAPQAAEKLRQAMRDLDDSNALNRLARSAQEVQFGRAREAATREGLITEAIRALEKDLRETARVASTEGEKRKQTPGTEALLSELAEARRAYQEALRGDPSSTRSDPSSARGDPSSARGDPSSAGGDSTSARNEPSSERGNSSSSSRGDSSSASNAGAQNGNVTGGGGNTAYGWGAWDAARGVYRGQTPRELPSNVVRDTQALNSSLRELGNRANSRGWTNADIEALRQATRQVRRLQGDPLAARSDVIRKLVDQIELLALSATDKNKSAASTHVATTDTETAQDRESVAEYYRRLGGD